MMPDETKVQKSNKNKALYQSMKMAHPDENGLKRSSFHEKVLKMTNENITK